MTLYDPLHDAVPGRTLVHTPSPEEEAEEEQASPESRAGESRFAKAVEKEFGTQTVQSIEQMFIAAGADMDDPAVQAYLDFTISDFKAADTEEERTLALANVQVALPAIAEAHPAVPATTWSENLAASNLEGMGSQIPANVPRYGELGAYRDQPLRKFVRSPDTGWVMYVGGVLVNPDVPLGAPGAISYEPGSTAPGSPIWQQNVQTTWSDEKVAEWRKRLFENGYLTKDQSKVKGRPDLIMMSALSQYHEIRYQNGGTPLNADMAGVAAAGAEYNLTAKDFQVVIRNDVREQFRNTFGNDPSDAELESWTRFVTQTSLRAQRNLTKKGATPATAASTAANIASETLIERIGETPEAKVMQESFEENTSLRDALQSAVVATRSLAGG